MTEYKRLELSWLGKEIRPRIEPRILLEDKELSWCARSKKKGDLFDNRLIFGHKRHVQCFFTEENTDQFIDTVPEEFNQYCSCGNHLEPADKEQPRIFQQIELYSKGFQITQYQMRAWICPKCGQIHYGRLSYAVQKAGYFGPQLQAVVVYMKGRGHLSLTTIQSFFRDIYHIPVSIGYLLRYCSDVLKVWKGLMKRQPKQ